MNTESIENIVGNDSVRSATARAGKYLTFHLADEVYGIEILKVREIIGLMRITRIPGSATHIRGVINLRGKVIPVIDLRRRFGMPLAEATQHTCVLVVDIATPTGTMACGVVADAVSEVLDVMPQDLERAPSLCCGQDSAYVSGIAKSGKKVTILLDIDHLLTGEDLTSLAGQESVGQGEPSLA